MDRNEIEGNIFGYNYCIKFSPIQKPFAKFLKPVIVTEKYRVHSLEIWDRKRYYLAYYNTWEHWIYKPKGKEEKSAYKKIINAIMLELNKCIECK